MTQEGPAPSEQPTYMSAAAKRYFYQTTVVSDFTSQLMRGAGAISKCHIDFIESKGEFGIEYRGEEDDPIHADDTLTQFLCSMLLARLVDNFLTYLSEVLNVIFRCQPNLLRGSDDGYKLDFILNHQTMDELVARIAEGKVENLSRQSMRNLSEYFKKTLKVEVFRNEDELKDGIMLNEVRNLIVHRRGIADSRFCIMFPELNMEPGDGVAVDQKLVLGAKALFKLAVMNTDVHASKRFKFPPPTLPDDLPGHFRRDTQPG